MNALLHPDLKIPSNYSFASEQPTISHIFEGLFKKMKDAYPDT